MAIPSYIIKSKDGNLIKIAVKPNSKTTEIQIDEESGYLLVSLKSPPDKGKANKELVKYLSEVLDIPSSKIILTSGFTSRDKTVLIQNYSIEEIKEKIKEFH